LIVGDQATIDSLRIRCADLEDRVRRNRQRKRGAVWATVGIVSLGLVVWSSIHFLPRIVAPLIPIAWEEALGDGVVEDIAGIFGAFTDGEIKRCETADGRLALDILVGQLVNQVKTPYSFKVIVFDVDMVNALAAPGGRIVVFKKLLTEAKSPDEVAGVLAHEMGHVISRHPMEAVARSMGISLVFNVLIGGLGSGATGAAGQALVSSAYSRDAERDSDSIAFDILSGAQISSRGFADFFDRMSKEEGSTMRAFSFMSSHPPSTERAQAARNAVPANVQPALSDADWNALKAICGKG
jgi:predicted Zn-dependent protease